MKKRYPVKKALVLLLSVFMIMSHFALASAEEADSPVFTVASPEGAPGLALATLAAADPDHYTFLAAETITAEFSSQEADFIIAPLNAGARLYLNGKSSYKLAAVVSWGNLYLASQKDQFQPEDINGAELTLFGENTINSSITLYALEQNGIQPASVSYLAGAANTQQLLLTDENAIVLTAEPALTAAQAKNDHITGCPVNDLFQEATGNDGFTQAGLFVKAETAENQPEAVEAYLQQVEESCEKCLSDLESVAQAAVTLELLPNEKIAMSAIPHCSIRYMPAWEAKEQIEMTANIDIAQFGGSLPADDFYYGAQ
ncbi:MAG: hypothetical protein IKE58_10345 [Blautia sp.]|nr:hypothetical protein [Blautia sp.]